MKREYFLIPFALILVLLAFEFSISPADAQENFYGDVNLESGSVNPENGVWGSSFRFEINYTSSEGELPPENYPKLYLDGEEFSMIEADTSDENAVDGKVFYWEWTPGPENVGSHSFYFRVRIGSEKVVHFPENDNLEGPLVKSKPTGLSLNLKRKDDNLSLYGILKSSEENEELSGEEVEVYEVLKSDNLKVGTVQTDESGEFSVSVRAPQDEGIFRYEARFSGDGGYGEAESDPAFFYALNTYEFVGISCLFYFGLLGVGWYFLTKGIEFSTYMLPLFFGTLLGVALISILGILGLLLGGVVIGYFTSRNITGWKNLLKVGLLGGILLFAAYGLLTLINLFFFPESIALSYSLAQGALLKDFLIYSIPSGLMFILMMGVGAIFGETLRDVFTG